MGLNAWRMGANLSSCRSGACAPRMLPLPPLQVDLSGYGHLNLLPLASGAPLPSNIQRLEMDIALIEASDRVRCFLHHPPLPQNMELNSEGSIAFRLMHVGH